MSEPFRHGALTKAIIGAYYDVYNTLGYGFLEKVYENAMAIELRQRRLTACQQEAISVFYASQPVGEYYADLLVNDLVIVELKAVRELGKNHEAQLINYLKSTTYEVGLLFNFGPEPTFVRKILDNNKKGSLTWTRKEEEGKNR